MQKSFPERAKHHVFSQPFSERYRCALPGCSGGFVGRYFCCCPRTVPASAFSLHLFSSHVQWRRKNPSFISPVAQAQQRQRLTKVETTSIHSGVVFCSCIRPFRFTCRSKSTSRPFWRRRSHVLSKAMAEMQKQR